MFSSRLTGATRRLPQRLALVLTLTGCSGSTAHTPRTGASTESSTSEVALVSAESTGSSSGPRGGSEGYYAPSDEVSLSRLYFL